MMNAAVPLRMIIADGGTGALGGIREEIERGGFAVVADCRDGASATAAVVRERVQLCLVDAALPGAREVVAAIVSLPLAPKVVVIGPAADDEALFAAFASGASGYVPGDLEPGSLAGELESVAGGGLALAPAVAARLAEAARPLAPQRLTDRERQVLDLVAAGLTTAEIALRLRVSSAAVRRHLSSAVRQIVMSRSGPSLDQPKAGKT
jgi:DNA-binding NarL/FixJ family response regulator